MMGLVIIIMILISFIIFEQRFSESQTGSNPAFLAGYSRVSENDMLCSTSWIVHHEDSIDALLITEKIRQKILEIGEGYDIPERKITIKSINETTSRINVGGFGMIIVKVVTRT